MAGAFIHVLLMEKLGEDSILSGPMTTTTTMTTSSRRPTTSLTTHLPWQPSPDHPPHHHHDDDDSHTYDDDIMDLVAWQQTLMKNFVSEFVDGLSRESLKHLKLLTELHANEHDDDDDNDDDDEDDDHHHK